MIRKIKDSVRIVENLAGGTGITELRDIIVKDEFLGHGRVFAHIIVHPHSSIGYHQHVRETEPYYIMKGQGIFIDNDGSRTPVGPGDVCIINVNDHHGIENNTDEPLELIACVYNEAGRND